MSAKKMVEYNGVFLGKGSTAFDLYETLQRASKPKDRDEAKRALEQQLKKTGERARMLLTGEKPAPRKMP